MKTYSIMDFSQFEMRKAQMNEITGGTTTEELIKLLWDATPNGGSSTWTNNNDGSFSGSITFPNGTVVDEAFFCCY